MIKAVADFPGTSFLLAFDSEYLASALKRHGINKSDQYIDKIVQLRVPLPLISHKDMNAQIGEIFRACYRYGQASHSDQLRDAKKILFYAQHEVQRLEKKYGRDSS